ncbi:MAG: NAD-dependent epimerase/dehydratase family protein [Ketobacter sp.]|nr:MAG: NAD-dependent epimerase/dehydratase family protein [Ketobacter sp.]
MNILVLGAAGNVGRRTVMEALSRGHTVTASGRNRTRLEGFPPGVAVQELNITDPAAVTKLVDGQDVVVNATRPPAGEEQMVAGTTRSLLQGMQTSSTRLIVVGGAASLAVPGTGGRLLLDDPRFLSPDLRHIGQASLDQYLVCQQDHGVDCTYLSPPADLFAGERTGSYRLGRDELLLDAQGRSRISMEDFVVALLDEIELSRFRNQRFTVAY